MSETNQPERTATIDENRWIHRLRMVMRDCPETLDLQSSCFHLVVVDRQSARSDSPTVGFSYVHGRYQIHSSNRTKR